MTFGVASSQLRANKHTRVRKKPLQLLKHAYNVMYSNDYQMAVTCCPTFHAIAYTTQSYER